MEASDGVHNPVTISCICIEREKHLILRVPEVQCLAFNDLLTPVALLPRGFFIGPLPVITGGSVPYKPPPYCTHCSTSRWIAI